MTISAELQIAINHRASRETGHRYVCECRKCAAVRVWLKRYWRRRAA